MYSLYMDVNKMQSQFQHAWRLLNSATIGKSPDFLKSLSCKNTSQQDFSLCQQGRHNDGKKTIVLDLDETLVHSSFTPLPTYDMVFPLSRDQMVQDVYVCVRPGVDEFLQTLQSQFEIVVFTANSSDVSLVWFILIPVHAVFVGLSHFSFFTTIF